MNFREGDEIIAKQDYGRVKRHMKGIVKKTYYADALPGQAELMVSATWEKFIYSIPEKLVKDPNTESITRIQFIAK